MPKKPEEIVEDAVCKYADELGLGCRKVQWVGRKAAPDRLFVGNGKMVFIEFKAPGKKLEPLQDIERMWFLHHGIEVRVFDTILFATSFLEQYFKVHS